MDVEGRTFEPQSAIKFVFGFWGFFPPFSRASEEQLICEIIRPIYLWYFSACVRTSKQNPVDAAY